MATLTRNLKLRLSSDLSPDARYNLERIDQMGAALTIDTLNDSIIRSVNDIQLRPEDNSVGGTGSGGTVELGDVNQPLTAATLNGPLKLLSSVSGNTTYLTVLNNNTSAGTLTINTGNSSFTLNLPITNAEISASAGIVDTKLATISTAGKVSNSATTATNSSTANSIVARDASGNFSAGFITAALIGNVSGNVTGNLTGNVTGDLAGNVTGNLTGNVTGNVSGTAASITGNLTGDITSTGMATAIAPGVIVNGDVSATAAIAGSKISPVFGNQLVSTEQGFDIVGGTYTTNLRSATSPSTNVTLRLPPTNGSPNAVLITDGSGNTSWSALVGTGTVTSVDMTVPSILTVNGNPVTTAGTLALGLATQSPNLVLAGPTTGPAAVPTFRQLSTSEITEGSNLYHTALRAQDAIGVLVSDTVTAEMDYVTGTSISVTVRPDGFINSTGGLAESLGILRVDPTQATVKSGIVGADTFLIADSADSNNLKKVTASDILTLAGNGYSTTWTSGTTKAVTHSLNSRNVLVEVYDNTTYETVYVDSVVRTDVNTVTLTASTAPSGAGLTVLIKRIA